MPPTIHGAITNQREIHIDSGGRPVAKREGRTQEREVVMHHCSLELSLPDKLEALELLHPCATSNAGSFSGCKSCAEVLCARFSGGDASSSPLDPGTGDGLRILDPDGEVRPPELPSFFRDEMSRFIQSGFLSRKMQTSTKNGNRKGHGLSKGIPKCNQQEIRGTGKGG